jgi:hypothetical protein
VFVAWIVAVWLVLSIIGAVEVIHSVDNISSGISSLVP